MSSRAQDSNTQTQHFHPQGEDAEKGKIGAAGSLTFDENLWLWT